MRHWGPMRTLQWVGPFDVLERVSQHGWLDKSWGGVCTETPVGAMRERDDESRSPSYFGGTHQNVIAGDT